jgi:ATP-dependent RNA helicase HelY
VHLALATGPQVLLHHADQGAVEPEVPRPREPLRHDRVGLLTGDNSLNGEAPVVVMTTEVLRNMLYAGSRTLLGLGFVVMDEVHYLADRSRGAVWEEVIIHLPESVALVSLSATVSNAEEFGEWLQTVRGDTTTIVEERRPVPLYQHVMVGSGCSTCSPPPTSTPRPASSRRVLRSTTSWSGSRATTGPATG